VSLTGTAQSSVWIGVVLCLPPALQIERCVSIIIATTSEIQRAGDERLIYVSSAIAAVQGPNYKS